MSIVPPQLDDRSYDDILVEARERLHRYCPDWTDYNDSDPGMALVQLFAWLTELMLYRFNQVPERNYLMLLKQLGLEPTPAQPARTHVVVGVRRARRPISMPAGTRFVVSAESGSALSFETTHAIDLAPHPLQLVQHFDGLHYFDLTPRNAEPDRDRFHPLGVNPQVGSAFYLGFGMAAPPGKAAFPDRLVLHFFRPQAASPTARGRQPGVKLAWEYQSYYDQPRDVAANAPPDRWRPLTLLEDQTDDLMRGGRVVIRGPKEDCLATRSPQPTDDKLRYWIRCRVAQGSYPAGLVPEMSFVRANVVELEHRATFQDEVLGVGNGYDVEFQLREFPVDPASLELVLNRAARPDERCRLVEDFHDSGASDADYTLNRNSGQVRFGNGRHGRIPGAGDLVIARRYRAGGGAAGNVPAGAIKDLPIGIANIDSVSNPRPATGGRDEESQEKLLSQAGRRLRGNSRAVTEREYQTLAESVPGVGQAVVLPRRLLQHPQLDVPGAVTVVVFPGIASERSSREGGFVVGLPSQELLESVRRHLDERKPAGTELDVTAPRRRQVSVTVNVTRPAFISDEQLQEELKEILHDYFQPIPPLLDDVERRRRQQRGMTRRWEVGSAVHAGRLLEVVLNARERSGERPLVGDVESITFGAPGVQRIELQPFEVPDVTVEVQVTREAHG